MFSGREFTPAPLPGAPTRAELRAACGTPEAHGVARHLASASLLLRLAAHALEQWQTRNDAESVVRGAAENHLRHARTYLDTAQDALIPQSYADPPVSASEREYQRRTDERANEYARTVARAAGWNREEAVGK